MMAKPAKKSDHRIKKQLILVMFGLMILAATFGCGNPAIDLTDYGTETITLIGLDDDIDADEDKIQRITLTISELQSMDCVTVKTNSTSDKIGNVKATGPLLETVTNVYGETLSNFSKLIITATDGYEIVLNQPFISENKLILAFGIDGQPLGEDEAPLRLIVPESDSAYWIRMIESIEFIR